MLPINSSAESYINHDDDSAFHTIGEETSASEDPAIPGMTRDTSKEARFGVSSSQRDEPVVKAQRCWFDQLGNATDPATPGVVWEPSWSQCNAAATNAGSDVNNNAAAISEKMQHGKPIRLVTIGGSVSCGCRNLGNLGNSTSANTKQMVTLPR